MERNNREKEIKEKEPNKERTFNYSTFENK